MQPTVSHTSKFPAYYVAGEPDAQKRDYIIYLGGDHKIVCDPLPFEANFQPCQDKWVSTAPALCGLNVYEDLRLVDPGVSQCLSESANRFQACLEEQRPQVKPLRRSDLMPNSVLLAQSTILALFGLAVAVRKIVNKCRLINMNLPTYDRLPIASMHNIRPAQGTQCPISLHSYEEMLSDVKGLQPVRISHPEQDPEAPLPQAAVYSYPALKDWVMKSYRDHRPVIDPVSREPFNPKKDIVQEPLDKTV